MASEDPDLLSGEEDCGVLGPDRGLFALEGFFGPDAVFYLITAVRHGKGKKRLLWLSLMTKMSGLGEGLPPFLGQSIPP